MARPLRLELAGGVYHVTSRGDGREDIYLSDDDREVWLEVFGQTCERFNWVCHAWCQMTNHYHILIETPDANLAQGMRHLNGLYTQRFSKGVRSCINTFCQLRCAAWRNLLADWELAVNGEAPFPIDPLR